MIGTVDEARRIDSEIAGYLRFHFGLSVSDHATAPEGGLAPGPVEDERFDAYMHNYFSNQVAHSHTDVRLSRRAFRRPGG